MSCCAIGRFTQSIISEELRFAADQLFLDRYGEILELSRTQQLAMRVMIEGSLKRIDFGPEGLRKALYPIERTIADTSRRLILVSPLVSFGVIRRVGVSTHIIADRLNAEPEDVIMEDYGLEHHKLEEATAYEAAA